MKVQNTLTKSLETADAGKASLDRVCKKLLPNKVMFAPAIISASVYKEKCQGKEKDTRAGIWNRNNKRNGRGGNAERNAERDIGIYRNLSEIGLIPDTNP